MKKLIMLILCTSSLSYGMSGKLLLTSGVTQIEGAAGGGITPWAFITGHGTADEVGASVSSTETRTSDFEIKNQSVSVGFYDRVELSYGQLVFNTLDVGSDLGVGDGFKIQQNIIGLKVRLYGNGVLDQDSYIPQISIGAQVKENQEEGLTQAVNADSNKGDDYYLSLSKIMLEYSFLYNLTLRHTNANQLGVLGFGGDKNSSKKIFTELSFVYLINPNVALGVEYREKPNNLSFAKEEAWKDIFIAWQPTKNISLTLAYAELGQVTIKENQNAFYSSLQVGF